MGVFGAIEYNNKYNIFIIIFYELFLHRKLLMTLLTRDTLDQGELKNLKKVACLFVNRNENVVPLHCEKQRTMHRSAMQQAENANAHRCSPRAP